MKRFGDLREDDRHSPKGKGEGNNLQKVRMNDIYLWRTIQARLILFCVWIKLEN